MASGWLASQTMTRPPRVTSHRMNPKDWRATRILDLLGAYELSPSRLGAFDGAGEARAFASGLRYRDTG